MENIQKKIKFLKSYDLFGYPISLSFKKQSKYTTICGGILSLTIIIFFLLIFTYSIYKLFNQQYKETSKYMMNLGNQYGSLDLNTNNFMIAIKFDSESINNWSKPFINISMYQTTQLRNSTSAWKIKKKLNMTSCSKEHFNGLETEFEQLQLNSALCPILSSNLTLQGNFQESIFSYLAFTLTSCVDTNICQTNTTIYNTIKKLDRLRFQIFIINNNVNELNFENPIKRNIISDMHFLIDPIKDIYKTADIYLTETEIITDYGYTPTILNNFEKIKNFTYLQEFREQTVFTSTQTTIAEFYIRKSQNKIKYERKLGNILTLLSYLGGIWSSCYFFIYIIVLKYTENSFITNLSNKIYNYPSQIKKKIKKNNENKKNLPIVSEKFEKSYDLGEKSENSPGKKSIFSNIIIKIKEYLNYDRKLTLTFFEMTKIIVKSIFSCKDDNEKAILFKKSEENLMKDLDILNILKRLNELEKIKNILFTEDQQTILNFFPKPSINLLNIQYTRDSFHGNSHRKSLKRLAGKKNKSFLPEQIKFDDINIFKNLINCWRKLKSDTNNSEMNKKLIDFLGDEFSEMIDIEENDFNNFLTESQNIFEENKVSNLVHNNRAYFFRSKSINISPKKLLNKNKIKIVVKDKINKKKGYNSEYNMEKTLKQKSVEILSEELNEKLEELKLKSSKNTIFQMK